MINGFENIQKANKENMDLAMKSFGEVSKGYQAIAAEVADYSKKSFEEGSAAFEKIVGAKSVEKALEVQGAYAKTAYEGLVSEANKLGELYMGLAKEVYKPFETAVAKASK